VNSSTLGSVIAATASKQPRSSRILLVSVLALASLSAILLTPSRAPASVPVPKLSWHTCPKAKGFQCATVRVPLDYSHPRGRMIHLAVIRHRATGPAHRIGTLFFNPGGPGGSGVTALPDFLSLFPAAVRARFDIASWDPRGVGQSTAVQCFASSRDEGRFFGRLVYFPVGNAQMARVIRRYRAFGRHCERRSGSLLRHVSTADTARDLDLLRRAVGDRRVSYYGFSYGSFLGATYANLFPGHVRAVVLDGNLEPRAYVDPQIKANGGRFLNTFLRLRADQGIARTLNAFLDLCGAADTAHCAFSAGTPAATRAKYATLLRRLQRRPPSAKPTYAEAVSTPALFLGSKADWPPGAKLLQGLWMTGNAKLPMVPLQQLDPLSAILCSESPNPRAAAFGSLDRFTLRRSGPLGLTKLWATPACASWPATAADRYAGPWNRRTANPVLVTNNTIDPNTPYRGAVAMARELARARLLTVDGYGHGVLVNQSDCANRYISRYLIDKVLPPKGKVCQQDPQPFSGSP
jgi:pimeloyl-ACP methyl ester carboxylesterase